MSTEIDITNGTVSVSVIWTINIQRQYTALIFYIGFIIYSPFVSGRGRDIVCQTQNLTSGPIFNPPTYFLHFHSHLVAMKAV